MSRILWIVGALALGAIGFVLGQYHASAEKSPAVVAYREALATTETAPSAPDAGGAGSAPAAAETDAIRPALLERDPFVRAQKLATLLPKLGPEHVAEAKAMLEDRGLELGLTELALLVDFWASHEPRGAAEWALWQSPMSVRKGLVLPAFERWGRSDPEAAREAIFAITLAPSAPADVAAIGLIRGWYASGQPGIETYLHGLGPGFEQQRGLATLARQIGMHEGSEAVMRWAEGLPAEDEGFKIAAYRQVGSELAQLEPLAAAAWCEAHCDGPFGSMVRSLVSQRWAAQDGPAAMAWIAEAPEGQEKVWAIKAGFRGWWRQDPEGFDAWAEAFGPEATPAWFQPALENYAIALSRRDPQRAIAWATAIEDDATRERTLVTIARNWRNKDQEAAEAWLAQSPLGEEARERARLPGMVQRPQRARPAPSDLPPELQGLMPDSDGEIGAGAETAAEASEGAPTEASETEAAGETPAP